MAERIIKPDAGTGNKLTLQDEGGTRALTVEDGGNVGIGKLPVADKGKLQIQSDTSGINLGLVQHTSDFGGIYWYLNDGTSAKWYLGMNDSAQFYLWNASTSSVDLLVSSAGSVTMPSQPAFLLRGNSGTPPVLTTSYTVLDSTYMSEVFDQGGNVASGAFTAPVTGRYFFTANCYHYNTNSGDAVYFRLSTSNNDFIALGDTRSGAVAGMCQISVLADMDASDGAEIMVKNNSSASTGSISVTNDWLWFSGYLVA